MEHKWTSDSCSSAEWEARNARAAASSDAQCSERRIRLFHHGSKNSQAASCCCWREIKHTTHCTDSDILQLNNIKSFIKVWSNEDAFRRTDAHLPSALWSTGSCKTSSSFFRTELGNEWTPPWERKRSVSVFTECVCHASPVPTHRGSHLDHTGGFWTSIKLRVKKKLKCGKKWSLFWALTLFFPAASGLSEADELQAGALITQGCGRQVHSVKVCILEARARLCQQTEGRGIAKVPHLDHRLYLILKTLWHTQNRETDLNLPSGLNLDATESSFPAQWDPNP